MAYTGSTSSSTLTQEFVSALSEEMLLAPDPQYTFATLALLGQAVEQIKVEGLIDMANAGVGQFGGNTGLADALMGSVQADPQQLAVAAGLASQFLRNVQEAKEPGETILINLPTLLTGTATESSRRMTQTTEVSDTSLQLDESQVPLTMREHGGPYSTGGGEIRPIGLTEWVKKRGKHNLVPRVGYELRRDFHRYVDRMVVDLFLSSSNQTIGSAGSATTAMVTGGNPLTVADLDLMEYGLVTRSIPTFSDGYYLCFVDQRMKLDLPNDSRWRDMNHFGAPQKLIRNHIGDYGMFHIVTSTTIPTTSVGSASNLTGYQGFACGPNAVGWGVGKPAEARRKVDDDYGRRDRFIWNIYDCQALLNGDFIQKVVTS